MTGALAILAGAAVPAPAQAGQAVNAPAWCGTASSASERTICSDHRLSSLDAQLNSEFQIAVVNITSAANRGTKADAAKFRNQQAQWLQRRNNCRANVSCLMAMYNARLRQMKAQNQPE